MPRLPNKNSQTGSDEPGALVFEHSSKPKTLIIIVTVVGFLVLVGGIYGGLRWHKNQLENKEEDLNAKMNELNKESRKPIINEALSFKNRANEAEKLLLNHKRWDEVFSLLEDITIPEVQYSQFSGDFEKKEINLELTTPSFKRTSQQILVYREVEEIEGFEFTPPKKSETGVSMNVNLTLSSQVWQKNN